MRPRLAIPLVIILALVAGFFVYPKYWDDLAQKLDLPKFPTLPFKLGLDLLGGTHLVYQADLSQIPSREQGSAMEGLKDVIERRVNLFGVSEPVVNVDRAGENWRLIVELAGVKDINQAIKLIGQTPYLEFKEERPQEETQKILDGLKNQDSAFLNQDPYFINTPLTGRFIKKSSLSFNSQTSQPEVILEFNDTGKELFAELTKRNVGRRLAIYLDGVPISAPVVQEEIAGGSAQITGLEGIKEARELVERLNAGALPVPINLISQQSIGASLGQDSLRKSLVAGVVGFVVVALFMILWYRAAGLVAIVALIIYTLLSLTLFKLFQVTFTLAGITGFILSIGMAVDANILIFERLKEELRAGKVFQVAMEEGFRRAWTSIRDSNVSSLITSVILYWFGTSLVRGFALTLGIGILVSMFSAITLTRSFLRALSATHLRDLKFLWRH